MQLGYDGNADLNGAQNFLFFIVRFSMNILVITLALSNFDLVRFCSKNLIFRGYG